MIKKLDRFYRKKLLGTKNYTYDENTNICIFYCQFDLYEFKCTLERYNILTKAIDWWNSLNATERHKEWVAYDESKGNSNYAINALSYGFKNDFANSLMSLYEFNQNKFA